MPRSTRRSNLFFTQFLGHGRRSLHLKKKKSKSLNPNHSTSSIEGAPFDCTAVDDVECERGSNANVLLQAVPDSSILF
jgi:hypothetical protein